MVRPLRNKKPVDYSRFEDSESDDDFISSTVPLNKKSQTVSKELKQDKPKPSRKNPQKEDILPEKNPKKRVPLDDKVFQRGLEVALALSVKELPTVTNHVQQTQDKNIENQGNSKMEIMQKSPCISNCSVSSDRLDLDKITEEGDACVVRGKRKAASIAQTRQKKIIVEGSEGDSAEDTEPDVSAGEGSEQDTEESEGDDEDFSVRKSEAQEIKKKEVKVKSPVEKKEKKSQPTCNVSVTSVDPAPAAIQSEFQSLPKTVSPSAATRKPANMCSPSAQGKRPKWVPPASYGSSNNSSSPLSGASAKSPSQSLRLGLSRLARVKPLHPNATSSQVW